MENENGRRRFRSLPPTAPRGMPAAEETSDPQTDADAVSTVVLSKLTPEERLICIWKRVGYSTREIARAQALPTGAIEALFRAAMAKIRR